MRLIKCVPLSKVMRVRRNLWLLVRHVSMLFLVVVICMVLVTWCRGLVLVLARRLYSVMIAGILSSSCILATLLRLVLVTLMM